MTFFAIMLIGLAALAIIISLFVISLIASTRSRKVVLLIVSIVGLGGLSLLVLIGGLLALWVSDGSPSPESEYSSGQTRPSDNSSYELHELPFAVEDGFVVPVDQPPGERLADSSPSEIKLSESSRPPATGDRETTEPRPAWVDEPAQKQGAVYRQVVHAGPYPRRLEAENELEELIARAIDDYLDEAIRPGAAELVVLPAEFVDEHIVQEEFTEVHRRTFGTLEEEVYMVDLYTRLEFGPEVRDEAKRRYRTEIVEDRLWIAGAGLAGMLALLGSVFGYLRVDDATGGKRRGRLRFVAGGAILTIIAAGVLIARWAPWM